MPGRKTDLSDAQWLCQLTEAGLLRGSFVQPKPVRALRALTRYRKTQVADANVKRTGCTRALEDTNIKLDCVASDILGKSGRAMLAALVAGTTDPDVLADWPAAGGARSCRCSGMRWRAYLQALYQRLRPRIGHGRAIGAVKHAILTAIWHMLSTGEIYREAGGDYFQRRDPHKITRRLVAQLERLGHNVTLQEPSRVGANAFSPQTPDRRTEPASKVP